MKEKLKNILRAVWSWRRWPYLLRLRRRVKNRRFLIIASDCNGALLLHDLGMPFASPTVNMAFHRFEKLCTHLDEYLAAPYRKICFTNDPAKTGREFVYIPDRKKNGYRDSWRTVGLSGVRVFERAMDIPAFLDNTAP